MAPFTSLQLRIWQDWATNVQVTTPVAGTWAAMTAHFLVSADYSAAGTETDRDQSGIGVFGVTSHSVANAVPILANDQVILTWNAARTQPNKYHIYYQNQATTGQATWDYTQAAIYLGSVNGHLLTATFANDDNNGTLAANHNSLTTITFEAIQDIMPQGREMMVPGYNGIYVPQSYGFTSVQLPNLLSTSLASFSSIALPMRMISCTHANRQTLHKWWTGAGPRNGWPCILIDANTSAHCVYDYYHVNILNISNLHSNSKMGTSGDYMIEFGVQGVHRA